MKMMMKTARASMLQSLTIIMPMDCNHLITNSRNTCKLKKPATLIYGDLCESPRNKFSITLGKCHISVLTTAFQILLVFNQALPSTHCPTQKKKTILAAIPWLYFLLDTSHFFVNSDIHNNTSIYASHILSCCFSVVQHSASSNNAGLVVDI